MAKIKDAPDGERATIDGTEALPLGSSDELSSWWASLSTFAAYIRTLTQTLTNKSISLTSNTLTGTTAEFNTALSDGNFATIAGSETLTSKTLTAPTIADFTNAAHDHGDADDGGALAANITLTTPTISGAITFPDNVRQTFNPGADAAGLNVGAIAGDPGTPSNGDLWYDSTANEMTARINGANVALGAGSVATDAIFDAKGDLPVGTGANTAAKLTAGANGLVLVTDSAEATGLKWSSVAGTGDVVGPASATDNAITRFDSTTGKLVQNSAVTIDDTGIVSFPDNVRQTFNPGADAAGLNVGSVAGDPGTPSNGDVWYDSTANELTGRINGANVALGAGGGGNHAYYTYLAAALEPDAIEPLQTGSFSYAVGGSVTKLLIASFNTRLGSTGRFEVRDPRRPAPLRGVTLAGLGASATAAIIDPVLPTYADARDKYFDRLQALYESTLTQLDIVDPAVGYPFLLGAYGGIVVRVVNFDFDYISVQNNNLANGLNLMNEENDGVAQREDNPLFLALNKFVATELYAGAERSAGVGQGTVLYYLCPSTWSVITDATSYDFRDDFMGASIDTATKWTRAQSTAGNVEIVTVYQWCKLLGTSTWGQNGMYSQTGITRANNKVFMIDLYTGRNATANNSHMVGFSDGAGQSYTNFSHGVLFTSSGAANIIKIYENGNDRGTVGSGYDNGTIYRVKITLGAANNCTYKIQGGAYGALGSASFTTLSPSSNSSSTTPLYAGVSIGQTGTMYAGDARVY